MRIFVFTYDAAAIAIAANEDHEAIAIMREYWTPVTRNGQFYVDFGPGIHDDIRYCEIHMTEITKPGKILQYSH